MKRHHKNILSNQTCIHTRKRKQSTTIANCLSKSLGLTSCDMQLLAMLPTFILPQADLQWDRNWRRGALLWCAKSLDEHDVGYREECGIPNVEMLEQQSVAQ
eukprot:2571709-Amphidinium_carterae.1